MTFIILVLSAYLIGKLIQNHREKVERERVQREKRMAALEREQARQRKEQEKLWKEQQKQADQIAKHERRIADLEQKMVQAEADIEHWTQQVGNLYGLLDVAEMEQHSAVPGSKKDLTAQKRIVALNNQIHTAESKLSKAKYIKRMAEQELSA